MRRFFIMALTLMVLMHLLFASLPKNLNIENEKCKNICVFSSSYENIEECIISCKEKEYGAELIKKSEKKKTLNNEYDFTVAKTLPRPSNEHEYLISALFAFAIGTTFFVRHKARESWIKNISKKSKRD